MKTILLAACLLPWTLGCVPRYVKPTRPYPVEAAAPCPAMPEPTDDSQDAWSQWGAGMIDWGRDCATRHRALGDFVRLK